MSPVLYDVCRVVKLIETAGRMWCQVQGGGGAWSSCLMGARFQIETMSVLDVVGGSGCITTQMFFNITELYM